MTHSAGAVPGGVCLSGTGMSVPQRVVTNTELAQRIDTSDAWITQRTGIRSRHLVEEGTTVRHLAVDAVRAALEDASLAADELDFLMVATLTPEMCCPATATRVTAEIGATPAGAMDLSAACSGFVYGMNLAAALVQTGLYRHVAVIGAEVLSSIVDWNDRRTCVLFGDGAGAAIVSSCPDKDRGCLHQSMASDGNSWKMLYCPRTEADLPPDANGFTGAYETLQMNGREVYKFAVSTLLETIRQCVRDAGITLDDVAMVIPHQSNQRILESTREKLGLPPERFYTNIERYGNTSAASVPICLDEIRKAGRLHPGDLVLMVGLGGGLTWAASLWRL